MNTIFITGASSGIGKATAEAFSNHGWNVIATMRDSSAGADLTQRDNVMVAAVDVQRPETIVPAIDAGIARFGAIDIVINNAGFGLFGTFEELYGSRGREIFDVNVFGVMEVARAILPYFRSRRSGTIVNVSSAAGLFAFPLGTLYDATKYAVEGFSEALAYELLPLGISVKLIEPGLVRTRMVETIQSDVPPNERIADYEAFTAHTLGLFESMMAAGVPEAQVVAERIFDAATDGTDRLRYLVTEEVAPLLEMRRQGTDQEYVDQMRSMFVPANQ